MNNKTELKALFERLPEEDLLMVLQDLRNIGALEGAAMGIARLIEARGRAFMSEKQLWRFLHDAWFDNMTGECSRCGGSLPPDEMVWAKHFAEGRCGWCQWQWDKLASA